VKEVSEWVVMGSRAKMFELGGANSFASWIGSGQPQPDLENFFQNPRFFYFFYLRVKKILSDWVKKFPVQNQDRPLIYNG